jgi:hypothetical protein
VTISFRRGYEAESDGSGTTIAKAYASNNAGDAGGLGVGWLDPTGVIDVLSVTDTAGNTWTATPAGKVRNATQQYSGRQYYVPTGMKTSTGNTVTVTFTAAATFKRLCLLEYKSSNGAWTSSPLDLSAGATGSGTAMSSGNMVPTTANQIVIGFGGHGTANVGATSPYVLREPSGGGASTGATDRILSGGLGAPVAAQATATGSGQWVMLGMTFKDVVAAIVAPSVRPTLTPPAPSPSSGKARAVLAGGDEITDDDLLPNPRQTDTAAPTIVNDYWWPAGLPDPAAQIPLTWFSSPLGMRLERPYNHAEVSQVGGVDARADNLTSIAFAKGVYPFSASLTTAVDADASNLAHWTVTYYGDPRMRSPALKIDLLYRTDDQKRFLLRLGIGTRIRITGVPAAWPAGADHLVIVGIGHEMTLSRRILRWTTQPVVGLVPGVAGPWFRWGSSFWGSADTRPF